MCNDASVQPRSTGSTWLNWFLNFSCRTPESQELAKKFVESRKAIRCNGICRAQWLKDMNQRQVYDVIFRIAEGIETIGEVVLDYFEFNTKSYAYQVAEFDRHKVVKICCGYNREDTCLFAKSINGISEIGLHPNRWYPVLNINPVENFICHTRYDWLCFGNPYLLAVANWVNDHDKYIDTLTTTTVTSPMMIDRVPQTSLINGISSTRTQYSMISHFEYVSLSKMFEFLPGNAYL